MVERTGASPLVEMLLKFTHPQATNRLRNLNCASMVLSSREFKKGLAGSSSV
jgi:hypothetical protein